ncbi:MAG TPA: hypothetical protein VIJ27_05330 [Mucilaginibacter sp.]|jgi:threonine dehydrogenase-like Zn-dependent dehydrogenase
MKTPVCTKPGNLEYHAAEKSVLTKGNARTYITHRVTFDEVKRNFESWIKPETGVIKAMVSMD